MAKKNNKKDVQLAAKVAKKAVPKSKVKKTVKKNGWIVPSILMLVSIILAYALITVRMLGKEDGAGDWGEWIQAIPTGLFGGAGFLFPLVLGFIGVLWFILYFKGNAPVKKDEEAAEGLRRLRRRTVSKTVLSLIFVLLLSVTLGIFADDGYYTWTDAWDDGCEEFVAGGTVGGAAARVLVNALEVGLSATVLIILLLVVFCFTVGITPEYIANRIRLSRELRDEEIEIDEEESQREYERMRQRELERAKKRKMKALEAERRRQLAEELEEEEEEEPSLYVPPTPKKKPVKKEPAPEFDADEFVEGLDAEEETETEVFTDPEPKPLELGDEPEQKEEESNFTEFGGDPVIDGETYTVEELMKRAAAAHFADTPEPAAEEQSEDIKLGEIKKEELTEDLSEVEPEEGEIEEEIVSPYVFPPVEMLSPNKNPIDTDITAELQENARRLKETLESFKVKIRDINYSRGPTITRYELKPEVGTRVRSIANLVDDIALSLATTGVRIEAPIPNKAAVGIEVPNRNRATVYLRDLIENSKFTDAKSRLTSCLGMDVGGNPVYFDVGKMPHLLIAGTTGSGKSVCINTIILSILYKSRPDEVKLILVDPKQVEFTVYEDIPHLYCPIVSEPKKAAGALASAVSEMERRFELIKEVGVRNIEAYNEVTANDPSKEYMPKMVIIIDELADLMMTARDEVETSICRLAQKARAAGIHVVLGTQRPSVDVITGLIKANVPSRIACTVTSQVDSRTIIDVAGAENLIGYGDMLFAPVGSSKPMRVQGAFVSDGEVENIVSFIKENNTGAKYNQAFMESMDENTRLIGAGKKGAAADGGGDSGGDGSGGENKFADAVKLAIESGKISTSLMQRKLKIGYGRAAKIIDQMEELGYVGPADGAKPRAVLITMEQYMSYLADGSLGSED